MTLKAEIEQEMVQAAKAKDKARLSALRLIKNGLHNREIDLRRAAGDAEILQMLAGMVKQRKESIELFEKGGRPDLAEKERSEVAVIEGFLPAPMSPEELEALIAEVIRDLNATGPRDMGKVMAALMPKVTGKADGKLVGEKVKAWLSQAGS